MSTTATPPRALIIYVSHPSLNWVGRTVWGIVALGGTTVIKETGVVGLEGIAAVSAIFLGRWRRTLSTRRRWWRIE